jgi:predicted aldo/keto reductase-like oxidoreductase
MRYATLGKTGFRVSRLGFGCMRLPMKSDKEVDREKVIPMLRRAVELGINYFDSAVMYCGHDSERVLGEAMEGIRDQVVLSTKNHHYDKGDVAGWWKNLEDSLELLRTDCIDVYNVHGLNYEGYESSFAGEDGLYKQLLKAKEQGLIRHICHSFHGSCESLKKMVDTALFDSVTCQYNLLDRHLEEGIAYAAEHGMGVVIMGPIGGGRLGYPSEKAAELVGEVKSTPELALRFVLSNPSVTVALSGMGTMQMLEENVETVSRAGDLSEEDHGRIEGAIQERKQLMGLYCTGCGYCMPCPEGVDIPKNFEFLNLERVFGLTDHARATYASLGGKAALCRLCGKCVEPCPQDLDIPARLAEAVAVLDERAGSVTGWSELRGASAGERGMLDVQMRYHLKNFTDQAQKVEVEFQPHGEDQVAPDRFALDELKPYGRRHKDVRVEVRPPLEALSLDAVLTFDSSHMLEHLHHVVTVAPRHPPRALAAAPDPPLRPAGQRAQLRLRRRLRRGEALRLRRRRGRPALRRRRGGQGPHEGRQPHRLPRRAGRRPHRAWRLRGRCDARQRLPPRRRGRRAAGKGLQRGRRRGPSGPHAVRLSG